MTEALERCWFASFPWNKKPEYVIPFFKRVYIKPVHKYGHCIGYVWSHSDNQLEYAIAVDDAIYRCFYRDLIPLVTSVNISIEKPQFKLGEIVDIFSPIGKEKRHILGVELVNNECNANEWFYYVEWESPKLERSLEEGLFLGMLSRADIASTTIDA